MLIRLIIYYFYLIDFVQSISNQEDLQIKNYSQIGCLELDSEKEFFDNYIQINSLFPYQTYATNSNMTIDLCFRLCRRLIILINSNHSTCICLYTIEQKLQFTEYLGNILPVNNCSKNHLQIYSLTNNYDLLPKLSSIYDWSFDGCYYLHGIQTYRYDLMLNHTDYDLALDLCRIHCQSLRKTDYFSYFLSLRKFCYCLPIKLSLTLIPKAIRKPIIHCSFLSNIDDNFNLTDINFDTAVKINVQRYCSLTFIYFRDISLCLKLTPLSLTTTYTKILTDEMCLPLKIKSKDQWNNFISSIDSVPSDTLILVDISSKYIFQDLFNISENLLTKADYCILINRTNSSDSLIYELVLCSNINKSLKYMLCLQNPLDSINLDRSEFLVPQKDEQYPIDNDISCPTNFVLFNNMCYYVDTSFIYNIRNGEEICKSKYTNSSLVKFYTHEWANVNSTRFLGRYYDDVLLEFFYYQLEEKLSRESNDGLNKKHWLRLLIGDRGMENSCVLRYFIRSSGAFTIFHRCNHGGHAVCQTEPIKLDISYKNYSVIEETSTTQIRLSTTIYFSNKSNQTVDNLCNNCTNLTPDEDLYNNETHIDYLIENQSLISHRDQSYKKRMRILFISGTCSLIMLAILTISFLVLYIRRTCRSFSPPHSAAEALHRKKRSSVLTTSSDMSNTPAVHYTRLKSPSVGLDIDLIDASNSFNDDKIQLLPEQRIEQSTCPDIDVVNEIYDEPFYATPKLPTEK